jgi:hypothetical protein
MEGMAGDLGTRESKEQPKNRAARAGGGVGSPAGGVTMRRSLLLPLLLALTAAIAASTAGPLAAATLVVANKSDATASLVDLGSGRVGAVWLSERLALVTAEAGKELLEVDVEAGTVVRAIATGAGGRWSRTPSPATWRCSRCPSGGSSGASRWRSPPPTPRGA